MGRNLAGSCRKCRREGMKLFLKGARCHSAKCPIEQRSKPPGMHVWRRGKNSEYAVRLREKQKVKRYYGVLERQFMKYFRMAERTRGNTGAALVCFLERRLDNVVCKLGFAHSHKAARQLISHGHIHINGRKLNIPSYLVQASDRITVKASPKSEKLIRVCVDSSLPVPMQGWLDLNKQTLEGAVKALPTREDLQIPVEEQLIVELCSR